MASDPSRCGTCGLDNVACETKGNPCRAMREGVEASAPILTADAFGQAVRRAHDTVLVTCPRHRERDIGDAMRALARSHEALRTERDTLARKYDALKSVVEGLHRQIDELEGRVPSRGTC